MVLGIASLLLPFAGIVTAIIGLILGFMANKKQRDAGFPSGMAIAGIVCSIITLATNVVLAISCYIPIWCLGTGILSGCFGSGDFF